MERLHSALHQKVNKELTLLSDICYSMRRGMDDKAMTNIQSPNAFIVAFTLLYLFFAVASVLGFI